MWFSPKLSIQTDSLRLHVAYHARLSDEIVTQKKLVGSDTWQDR